MAKSTFSKDYEDIVNEINDFIATLNISDEEDKSVRTNRSSHDPRFQSSSSCSSSSSGSATILGFSSSSSPVNFVTANNLINSTLKGIPIIISTAAPSTTATTTAAVPSSSIFTATTITTSSTVNNNVNNNITHNSAKEQQILRVCPTTTITTTGNPAMAEIVGTNSGGTTPKRVKAMHNFKGTNNDEVSENFIFHLIISVGFASYRLPSLFLFVFDLFFFFFELNIFYIKSLVAFKKKNSADNFLQSFLVYNRIED